MAGCSKIPQVTPQLELVVVSLGARAGVGKRCFLNTALHSCLSAGRDVEQGRDEKPAHGSPLFFFFNNKLEEKKTMQQEDSEEEDKIQHTPRSSSVQAQRLPVFPGMDHSVLKVSSGRAQ